ncbi:nucleoside triphosphate pyrophosphohydrolase [Pseudoalteromonas denitrificans]|uniref:Nucleoside triphosphate pyrophosphohydrolase n=1 Tax=Pseudoalteromonas denitrificans DSM 6059 TaxID=1123010 RepID=A0A1I1SA62_9GAMM|nr:nucleoside triphosphate pyrophosphohydrolase [Pseudoalteromonas denitrificans]SFD43336.1 ATP diphosphatase [Pseudoalteromonas denitrificans DSM 6059]
MSKHIIENLIEIMTQLRNPKTGCPWDLKQTFHSIIPHTIEEAYEVADAIEQGDFEELKKELGDLLFQVVFYAQLAKEDHQFNFNDVVETVCEKLTRRHPHVFTKQNFENEQQIKQNWENEKVKERELKAGKKISILADIPKNLPALSQANKIQKRVAHVGFDWPKISGAWDKVKEEVIEVEEALDSNPYSDEMAEEIGDLMFALVNVARHAKRDPEQLLRKANQKFTNRFVQVEEHLNNMNIKFTDATLEQMDNAWDLVKINEKKK